MFQSALASIAVGLVCLLATGCQGPSKRASSTTYRFAPWNEWPRAVYLENKSAECVIVPEIGRIMSFSLKGQTNPFWHDPLLHGKSPDPKSSEWINFGGDKTWPAPQADWEKRAGRSWPPPTTFDSTPLTASPIAALPSQTPNSGRCAGFLLSSPIDPHYGIRTLREIRLHPSEPILHVTTSYEKVSGPPIPVSVWVVTQLSHPEAMFVPIPKKSQFPEGFVLQGQPLGEFLSRKDNLLQITRNPNESRKIGSDGGALVWVGSHVSVRIDAPRAEGLTYPDGGCSVEVYTNPDPKPYIELETLSPLATLQLGARLSAANIYSLYPRSHPSPESEARAILAKPIRW